MLNIIKPLLSVLSGSTRKRGWRVGHQGRDSLFYDELIEGEWKRIIIDGEMQCSDENPQHVVWFPSADEWNKLSSWAVGRREQILGRVRVGL